MRERGAIVLLLRVLGMLTSLLAFLLEYCAWRYSICLKSTHTMIIAKAVYLYCVYEVNQAKLTGTEAGHPCL